MTAKRVIEKYGKENVLLLFTDTYIEDEDLYRFLLETTQEMFNIDKSKFINRLKEMPKTSHETMNDRKIFLQDLASDVSNYNPRFQWVSEGRDPWEVFKDAKFLGNSRIAQCSHELKQKASSKWIKDNYNPDECILYLGIDWTEEHRTKAPVKNWSPYEVRFPMCEEPYLSKDDMLDELEQLGIKIPRLYSLNFSHNNCGGMCVRAGQGHFINLLETLPELYKYHEEKEQEMIEYLNKDVSILRRQRNNVKYRLTLRQLREEYESKNTKDIDMLDIGGCGCFVEDDLNDED